MQDYNYKIIHKPISYSEDFTISVIIPIYNTELYLREALDSVVCQSIGIDNIQLILVNNATEDNAGSICEEFVNRFPNNTTYLVLKENINVSVARNVGKEFAVAPYVCFLDSDDKWECDALSFAIEYLKKQEGIIDFVACRMNYFDGREGFEHPLDYKFEETAVIDIFDKPDHIQMAVNSCVFTRESLSDISFDEGLDISEDSLFVSQVLLKKGKYGVVRDAVYHYRRRSDASSAIDSKKVSKKWYLETPKRSYSKILEMAESKYGSIPPYYQYQVMYDIKYRLKQEQDLDVLDVFEKEEYIDTITNLLRRIDDSIIFGQKRMPREYKLFALQLKYGEDYLSHIYNKEAEVFFDGTRIHDMNSNKIISLVSLEQSIEETRIAGFIKFPFPEEWYEISFIDNQGNRFKPQYDETKNNLVYSWDKAIHTARYFSFSANSESMDSLNTIMEWKGQLSGYPKIRFARWGFLKNFLNNVHN